MSNRIHFDPQFKEGKFMETGDPVAVLVETLKYGTHEDVWDVIFKCTPLRQPPLPELKPDPEETPEDWKHIL